MNESIRIPADMIDTERSEKAGCKIVSIRDMMILLGVSDEKLRDMDERDEILAREPWRKDSVKFVPCGEMGNGWKYGTMVGEIDWTGTRFEGKPKPFTEGVTWVNRST